eukprot:Skav216177  [mRNA]  locus=scaffold2249:92061:98256:+ [translate_table: standard]
MPWLLEDGEEGTASMATCGSDLADSRRGVTDGNFAIRELSEDLLVRGFDERDAAFLRRLRNLAGEALTWQHLGARQRLVWAAAAELEAVPLQEQRVQLWVAQKCTVVTNSHRLPKKVQAWLRNSNAEHRVITANVMKRLAGADPSSAADRDGGQQQLQPLRQCQLDCLEACARGARVIEMACGSGKTRVIKELVTNTSGRVMITVPLRALLDQFAPDFPGFCKVGVGHNERIDFDAEGFIAVTNSVHLLKKLKFQSIFVDEAHHPLPPKLPKTTELYRFSATHQEEADFRYTMGQAIEDGVLCDYDITVPALTAHHAYVCLADLLVKQAGRFRRVLAYCNTVREAKRFRMVLKKLGLAAWHMNAQTPSNKRATVVEDFAGALQKPVHVLVTVEVLGEGINIPNADTCMFVEPRNSYRSIIQAIGRVLRHHPAKTLAHIVLPAVAIPDSKVSSQPNPGEVQKLKPAASMSASKSRREMIQEEGQIGNLAHEASIEVHQSMQLKSASDLIEVKELRLQEQNKMRTDPKSDVVSRPMPFSAVSRDVPLTMATGSSKTVSAATDSQHGSDPHRKPKNSRPQMSHTESRGKLEEGQQNARKNIGILSVTPEGATETHQGLKLTSEMILVHEPQELEQNKMRTSRRTDLSTDPKSDFQVESDVGPRPSWTVSGDVSLNMATGGKEGWVPGDSQQHVDPHFKPEVLVTKSQRKHEDHLGAVGTSEGHWAPFVGRGHGGEPSSNQPKQLQGNIPKQMGCQSVVGTVGFEDEPALSQHLEPLDSSSSEPDQPQEFSHQYPVTSWTSPNHIEEEQPLDIISPNRTTLRPKLRRSLKMQVPGGSLAFDQGFGSQLERFLATLMQADHRLVGTTAAHRIQIADCTLADGGATATEACMAEIYGQLSAILSMQDPWEVRLQNLEAFVNKQGRLPSSNSADNRERTLGIWIKNQGLTLRAQQMPLHRFRQLLASSPLIRRRVERWQAGGPVGRFREKCRELREHLQLHGGLPTQSVSSSPTLGRWLANVRRCFPLLHPDQKKMLQEVHPLVRAEIEKWGETKPRINLPRWERRLAELSEFVSGRKRIPQQASKQEERRCYHWLRTQCRYLRAGILPSDLAQQLRDTHPLIVEYLTAAA